MNRRWRIVIVLTIILLIAVLLIQLWKSYQRPVKSLAIAASTIVGLALEKKPQSSALKSKTNAKKQTSRPAVTILKEDSQADPECFDLWSELEEFNISALMEKIETVNNSGAVKDEQFMRDLFPNFPDAEGCSVLPPDMMSLKKKYHDKCSQNLEDKKIFNECINLAITLRSALSYVVTDQENLENIHDPEILFDRVLYLINLEEKKDIPFSEEYNEKIHKSAERLLHTADTKLQKTLAAGAYLMSGVRKIPFFKKLQNKENFLKLGKPNVKKEFDSMNKEINSLKATVDELHPDLLKNKSRPNTDSP